MLNIFTMQLFFSDSNNPNDMKLQTAATQLLSWFTDSRTAVNLSKTKEMVIHLRNDFLFIVPGIAPICIDGNFTECVDCFKLLVVCFCHFGLDIGCSYHPLVEQSCQTFQLYPLYSSCRR